MPTASPNENRRVPPNSEPVSAGSNPTQIQQTRPSAASIGKDPVATELREPRRFGVTHSLAVAWLVLYGLICFFTFTSFPQSDPAERTLSFLVFWHIVVTIVWTVSLFLVHRYAFKPSVWGYVWRTVLMVWLCASFSGHANRQDDSMAPFIVSLIAQWPFAWFFYGALQRKVKRDLESSEGLQADRPSSNSLYKRTRRLWVRLQGGSAISGS